MHLGFSPGELDNIGANQTCEGVEGSLRIMLAEWMEWIPGDHRGSNQVASLVTLKDAIREAGYGRTANSLSLSREQANGNARVRTSTERNGSADEQSSKRSRQE